jgi:hypothetical protein
MFRTDLKGRACFAQLENVSSSHYIFAKKTTHIMRDPALRELLRRDESVNYDRQIPPVPRVQLVAGSLIFVLNFAE